MPDATLKMAGEEQGKEGFDILETIAIKHEFTCVGQFVLDYSIISFPFLEIWDLGAPENHRKGEERRGWLR